MSELNPEHPVTKEVHSQWHKLCALLMMRIGARSVRFDEKDIQKLAEYPGGACVLVDSRTDGITLFLMSESEALELLRNKGKSYQVRH